MSSKKAENEKVTIEITAGQLVNFLTSLELLRDDEEANPYHWAYLEYLYDTLGSAYEKTLLSEEMKLINKRFMKSMEKFIEKVEGSTHAK